MLGKTKLNKQAATLLICIISAFCLWVYVSYVENPDMTRWIKNVPITVTGEAKLNEKGLALKDIPVNKIDLKIRAKRNMFKDLSANTITAIADVSSLNQTGEHAVTVTVSFNGSATGLTVSDRNHDDITVIVDEYITQSFPVESVISKQPSDGYYVKSESLASNSKYLTVSGCKSNISMIHHIATEPIDLSNATSNQEFTAALTAVDENGKAVDNVKLSQTNINIYYEIYKQVELPLEINLITDSEEISYELSVKSVLVSGPAATADATKAITVTSINENGYEDGDTKHYAIVAPSGLTLVEGEPTEVVITFKKQN